MDYLGWLFWSLILSDKTKELSSWNNSGFCPNWFYGLNLGSHYWIYTTAFSNGTELVSMAMTGTAAIFLSLSFYALYSKKDFSFLSGFLTAGIVVAFLAGIAAYFFQIPTLALTVSAAFILLMSGLILFETSNIIRGGETNYIMATVTLYISIYNLFLSLLHLLGVFSGDD